MVPASIPYRVELIHITGVLEMIGAISLWIPGLIRLAGLCLITWVQAPLAVLGFVCSAVAWLSGSSRWWLVGGLLLGTVVPYTFAVIAPANRRLLSPDLDKKSEEARRLLLRWNALHAVRTTLSVAALVVFLLSA